MGPKFAKLHAASLDKIKDIIKRFTYAAELLYRAEHDRTELHGAYRYLLTQFFK